MKRNVFITILFVLMLVCNFGYARTTTTNLGLVQPTWTENVDILTDINSNSDLVDAIFDTVSLTEFSYLNNVTSNIQAQLDAKDLSLYYLKTQIDTLPELEAIYGLNITTSTELATALTLYYLKTAIDTQAEMEAIWGVDLANAADLHTQNTDTALGIQTANIVFEGATANDFETTFAITDPTADRVITFPNASLTVYDWTADQGAVNIHAGNYTDTNTTYTGDTEIVVTGTVLSIASTIARDTELHATATVSTTNGLSISGQEISLQAASTNTHGALTDTDWNTFNGKQAGDTALTNISALVYEAPSFIKLIADDTYAVRTWAEVKQDLELEVGTDIQAYSANTAFRTDKLSAFAATSSAELAGVISDEIGAGKARFDTAVTAKTTTALLTEAEAGTILCSAAGGAYTITLPTASGNTGLTYHFIKTDANYTLITLAANGAQTFNYENSTGAPVLTYARLNTYCAEVTIVSDGANWQCLNERLGQVPEARVYLGANQLNILHATWTIVSLDTENFDIGSNFDIGTYKFVAPIPGMYQIFGHLEWLNVIADKLYQLGIYNNNVIQVSHIVHSASTFNITNFDVLNIVLAINDYVQLFAVNLSGVDTVDVQTGTMATWLSVKLVSKT